MKNLLFLALFAFVQPALAPAACWGDSPAPRSAVPVGKVIKLEKWMVVSNTSGNCAYCAIETCARAQGFTELDNSAWRKGGSTDSDIKRLLDKTGIEYYLVEEAGNRENLLRQAIDSGRPCVFTIPGHALVCNGYSDERVWVTDNTGKEGLKTYGWTWSEWRKLNQGGYVCCLWRRPRVAPGPGPNPDPNHIPLPVVPVVITPVTPAVVIPAPVVLPAPTPVVTPAPIPAALTAALAELKASIDALKNRPAVPGPAGKNGVDGKTGPTGAAGPAGSAGTPADPKALAALTARVTALESLIQNLTVTSATPATTNAK